MKALAIRVGLVVALTGLASCAAGFGIAQIGAAGAAALARDVGVIILALFYLVSVVIWAAVYFGLAWAIGQFGGKVPLGLRWVNRWVYRAETLAEAGVERGAVRPLARASGGAAAARAFLSRAGRGRRALSVPE
jgi:hypothetical protein